MYQYFIPLASSFNIFCFSSSNRFIIAHYEPPVSFLLTNNPSHTNKQFFTFPFIPKKKQNKQKSISSPSQICIMITLHIRGIFYGMPSVNHCARERHMCTQFVCVCVCQCHFFFDKGCQLVKHLRHCQGSKTNLCLINSVK